MIIISSTVHPSSIWRIATFPYLLHSAWHYPLLLALLAATQDRSSAKKQCLETMLARWKEQIKWEKGGRKKDLKKKKWDFFFHGFLISSGITEHDELSRVMIPPRGLLQRTPTLWWSSMNSPYCCLMKMGTQANEQPLPGSAPQVLINPDAEMMMALIFQNKRCLLLTASRHSHNKSEFQSRDPAQRQKGL